MVVGDRLLLLVVESYSSDFFVNSKNIVFFEFGDYLSFCNSQSRLFTLYHRNLFII